MSRSATDVYTRFTSTPPHASSKNPRSSSTTPPQFGSYQTPTSHPSQKPKLPPGPLNETPQEKVARLRAASRLAKSQASLSPVDRTIEYGRRVADKTHRIVAYGLIGFSGIAALISVYAMTDLVLHHRRQKRAWIDRELQRLQDAQQAFLRGDATPEQLHLLQQERAGDEIVEKAKRERERKKRESWWRKGKALIGLGPKEGLSPEEEARYGRVQSRAEMEVLPGERLLEEEQWVGDKNDGKSVTEAVRDMVEDRRRTGEKQVDHLPGTHGGPLDVLASNITNSVRTETGAGKVSWFGWGQGKDQS
ncbi:hypothetical protein GJ744_007635 [Endocarpon pusillum]|uniref:Cytochrome oxidase c assembly-domain-containing protein n=1 Tax=Endocarpon pusillum TaxID=364733 RepID=A0A8H7AKF9_9EURO|nr:hypothetical protein GJ744_007635 [Endocarpon pusillum]